MTPTDIDELAHLIGSAYYPETFRLPPPGQMRLWYAELAAFTPEEALEALRRWVTWHRDYPPQLGELTRRCHEVHTEAARWRRPVDELPMERTPDQATFGQLMAQLAERAVTYRLSLGDCAQCCVAWAQANVHRPHLARELLAQAQAYRALAAEEHADAEVLG